MSTQDIGDYRIYRDGKGGFINIKRRELINGGSLGQNVEPGDCVHVDDAGAPTGRMFTFFWLPDLPSYDTIRDFCYDEGYEVVRDVNAKEALGNGVKFSVKDRRWRRGPGGTVISAWGTLYALPAEKVDEREAKQAEQREAQAKADAAEGAIHAMAQEIGAGSFVQRGKETVNVVRPRK